MGEVVEAEVVVEMTMEVLIAEDNRAALRSWVLLPLLWQWLRENKDYLRHALPCLQSTEAFLQGL